MSLISQDDIKMKIRSGKVTSNNKIVTFFYLLMRDCPIGLGEIERIVQETVDINQEISSFTNGWLAEYAKYIVERLEK